MLFRSIFYRRIRPEGLFCDAERDLLAIAKFLVCTGAARDSEKRIYASLMSICFSVRPSDRSSVATMRTQKRYFLKNKSDDQ